MKNIKILLCGQFYEHSLESSYFRAFSSSGINVHKYRLFNHGMINNFFDKDRLNKIYSSYSLRKILSVRYNKNLLNDLKNFDFDVCFFFDLTYIFPETIHTLKIRGKKTICFLPDNPLKGYLNYRPEIIQSIKELDIFLCWGTKIKTKLKEANYKNIIFHTYAWDSIRNKKFKIKKNKNEQIVFVGNWDNYREELINELSKTIKINIWGEQDWFLKSKYNIIKKSFVGKSAYNQNFSNICYNSFLNLNFLRKQSIDGGGLNMRSFEIIGEKGLILQNIGIDAKKIFSDYSEYLLFKNKSDLVKKITYMKENKNFFKTVKKDLFDKINTGHTYNHRVKKILNLL